MSSFLEKLNKRGITAKREEAASAQATPGTVGAQDGGLQVDVDVQQSLTDIVLVAPLPGVDLGDLHISVEGENDVVIIQGERRKPDLLVAKGDSMKAGETAMFLQKECQWGPFFRKIVLPQEVEVLRAQATLNKGLLILVLPIKKATSGSGTTLNVVQTG